MYLNVGCLFKSIICPLSLLSGQIMQALDKFNLRDNTLVYLTSDQGGHVEEISVTGVVQGGWNGIYKGVVLKYVCLMWI